MSGFVDRPSDLPLAPCSHCGGEHRAEAVPIDVGEPFPKYIAGTIRCPARELGPIAKSMLVIADLLDEAQRNHDEMPRHVWPT